MRTLKQDKTMWPQLLVTASSCPMRADNKAFAKVQGRFAKVIFILQMYRNIVSLNKLFGKKRFQTARPLAATVICHFMKTRIAIVLFIFNWNLNFGQTNVLIDDTLKIINALLNDLPNAPSYNSYVKYKFEYDKSSKVIKLFSIHFDNKTNEKTNQYNLATFDKDDIDPNAIVIKPYSNHSIMLQLIVKQNEHKINSSYFIDEKEVSKVKLDRASISHYNPKECKVKLERLKNVFTSFFISIQPPSNLVIKTDTGAIKTVIQKSNGKDIVVDYTKFDKNSENYLFGSFEESPRFMGSKTDKETEVSARKYLMDAATKTKYKSSGKVFIQFIIDENGKVKNPKILKGVNNELNQLSIKLMEEMPNWTPGKIKDKHVSTVFSTNIEF